MDITARLHQALLHCMADTPYQKITVCRLSTEAGIARQTFYQHFSGRDALLLDYADHMFDAFYQTIASPLTASPDPGDDISRYLFAQWSGQREFARLICANELESLLTGRFRAYVTRVLGLYVRSHAIAVTDSEKLGFMADYLAGAFWMVLKRWVAGGFAYDEQILAALFSRLTRPGFLAVLEEL
ncbi:MAG: TetR/AcrR family transcriptional regulator [Pseudomonadota bacterium]|nr:TetR/AcrR family transcriptional regulator [Pseudomonadota bacterium]